MNTTKKSKTKPNDTKVALTLRHPASKQIGPGL